MDWPHVLVAALSGGGVGGIALKLAQYRREKIAGELQREDTAITRWQRIADEREHRIDELHAEVSWYRTEYPRLFSAYMIGPPPGRGGFLPAPPPRTDT